MDNNKTFWQLGWQNWLCIFIASLLMTVLSWDALLELVSRWDKQEEYSHGYMIPFVVLYFIWQKKNYIQRSEFSPSWLGVAIVSLSLIVFLIGEISALYILTQYAFIALLIGLVLSIMGVSLSKSIIPPLLLLVFAIPLPYFIEASLTANLQLLSSKLGVAFIRLCQVPVYLEGNIIDLGVYKLQVIEACSGLRYLFPLMCFGYICGYLFNTDFWKRAVVFFTTIPITLLMNSFRIGVTGLLVNSFGTSMAEGFLHDFEGWIIFLACLGILFVEMLLLTKIGSDNRSLVEIFGLSLEVDSANPTHTINTRPVSYPLVWSVAVITVVSSIAFSMGKREEIIPVHKNYAEFPMSIDTWQGKLNPIEHTTIEFLGLSDYVQADYKKDSTPPVNLYVAYYETQRKGISPHSPSVCIPGGGWQLTDNIAIKINDLPINRMIIKKDDETQLVYYWFQERGHQIANQYLMKWYLLKDAVLLNRTDGALVRLTTTVSSKETIADANQRLQTFTADLLPILPSFVPN
jgi:exosortase D (VPLPA-CTERM-specific)